MDLFRKLGLNGWEHFDWKEKLSHSMAFLFEPKKKNEERMWHGSEFILKMDSCGEQVNHFIPLTVILPTNVTSLSPADS